MTTPSEEAMEIAAELFRSWRGGYVISDLAAAIDAAHKAGRDMERERCAGIAKAYREHMEKAVIERRKWGSGHVAECKADAGETIENTIRKGGD